MVFLRTFFLMGLILGLAACAGKNFPPSEDNENEAPRLASQDIVPLQSSWRPADFSHLPGWATHDPLTGWAAFLQSCTRLISQPDWKKTCQSARELRSPTAENLRQFFETAFQPWQLINPQGETSGLVTGYYEPLIRGDRMPSASARYPIYGMPVDLTSGRAYFTRSEINQGALNGRAPIIAWAQDPIELFFLEVQGSGRLLLPNGQIMRLGFSGHNGHPYRSIGKWLLDRGELQAGQASMQGIKAWTQRNPHRLGELLQQNPRFVFFREMPDNGEGPIGALNVPLTPGHSIAVDPQFIPLGTPVWLSTTFPASSQPLQRLMYAQDTGNAIKGAIRADFFWGPGAEAGEWAGRMKQSGQMWMLLPKNKLPPRP